MCILSSRCIFHLSDAIQRLWSQECRVCSNSLTDSFQHQHYHGKDLGTALSYFILQELQHPFSCQSEIFIMKYMDEQFLTLEGGQDYIDYWFHIDKELRLCEDIFPFFGFANPSVTLVLFKDRFCLFYITHLWKSFRKYEPMGSQLSAILVKAGINVNHLQRFKSLSSKPRIVWIVK